MVSFAFKKNFIFTLAVTLLTVGPASLQAEEDRLVLLNGKTILAEITRIDSAGLLHGKKVPPQLDLDGLRRIQRSSPADKSPEVSTPAAKVAVRLNGGGQLSGEFVTLADDLCIVHGFIAKKLTLSIDAIRSVCFEPKKEPLPQFLQALAKPSTDNDRLFVKVDGKTQVVTGLIEELTAEKVVIFRDAKQHTLLREKLYGIVFAQAGVPDVPRVMVRLRDSSLLPAKNLSLEKGQLKLQTFGDVSVALPWETVSQLTIRSKRLTFLSDLEPVDVVEQAIVTFGKPWRRDLSVDGRRLTLGERQFDKGIGVHSTCKLTYDIGAGHDTFTAVIGIDQETDKRGDCLFRVLGDGRSLYTQRVCGNDPPREIKIDITDVKRLTLAVESGEDLDLADHADWCDARLIRKKK